ncbi:hypothetical protein C2G38_2199913 [Gigaspora rosea]|uniref:PH domain-containing protein n=1 Tax=Gigaspora rosea TaxID=44941 RepID=A0A397UTL8_9GLOM|nr:hypothetical protein C2G38_2199913 [Gigaspora rosea]
MSAHECSSNMVGAERKLYLFSALICAPRERHSEEKLVAEEKHDVVAWVQVRLLDGKGRLSESPVQNDIQINLLPTQNVQFKRDRTSVIVAQASWDSTLYDSIFLNRTTHSSSRVLLGLAYGLFSVILKPPMTRKISELWRLNTASKYVCGEELLGDWKPHGMSLVKDYKKISESIRKKEAVDCIKQIIALKGNKECEKHENSEELYKKILTLWRKKWGTMKEIVINQELPLSGLYHNIDLSRGKKPTKLVAQVRMVAKTDTITKKGYLFTPKDANDDYWVKKWYVLRRPYLFIYESPQETEEQGAINLASVRVDY